MTLSGTKKLLVAGLKFTNETTNSFTETQVAALATYISNFYGTHSRGLLTITKESYLIDVPTIGTPTSVLGFGGNYVKKQYPGRDYYIIVSPFVSGDHSGDGFGYVKSCEYETGLHECGHLLGLFHSNTWVNTDGTWTVEYGQDGLSVMSFLSSDGLASTQYNFLGWIPESEIFRVTTLPYTVNMKMITAYDISGTSLLIVDSSVTKNSKDAYISFTQPTKYYGSQKTVALHLEYGNGAGSQKIKLFPNYYYDSHFTELYISLAETDSPSTVNVTIFAGAPAIAEE